MAALLDCLCALAAGLIALEVRFDSQGGVPAEYFAFTVALPFLWLGSVAVAGGYDPRFIGVGSDEFRKVLNAAVGLTAGIAIVSYVGQARSRARVCGRGAAMCRRLRSHRPVRPAGSDSTGGGAVASIMRRTVAVGHAAPVEDLVALLRRDSHHGLSVVAACVAGAQHQGEVADVPICGGLDSVASVVEPVQRGHRGRAGVPGDGRHPAA